MPGEGAVLVEPWTFISECERSYAERAKAVLGSRRYYPESTAPFGLAPLSIFEELEMVLQWLLWMGACVLPPASLAWLVASPGVTSAAVAIAVGVSMVWPCGEWPVPPSSRLAMPVRNRKIASAFMRYHPLRLLVEAPDELLTPEGSSITRLFAGVPHGLFPIGFVLLGFCNFVMPWRRVRAAAASVTLRLPLWRQVSLWNGGIDVSRRAIVAALQSGENVMVAMDGIAGMFAGRRHRGKEVFLLRRRKGLVRIALQTRKPLVPFVCFGNSKAVVPLTDPLGVMESLSRWLGVSFIYPGGRFGFLPIPKRQPITVVVGATLPLPPVTDEAVGDAQVDELHEQLIEALKGLYYRWRVAGGYADIELEVI